MLKEKLFYKEDLPVNVSALDIEEYPIHFHDDLEVAYVLSGSVKLKNGYYTYTMNPGDIFILNDREIHSFYRTEGPNTVMLLQVDLNYFNKYYDNLNNCFFVTDMQDADDESLEALRRILARIMLEFIGEEEGFENRIIESIHNLFNCLLNDFQYFSMEDGKFVNQAKNKGNKILAGRLKRITNYMYENHARRLTLNEIAEQEHLSIYYLSHVIKEATGLSFQELLSFIRVEESEKLLLGSTKKIGAIAEESGFSAVRYYIKYFEKWFGMHPAEYREKYTGNVHSRETGAKIKPVEADQVAKYIRRQVKDVYGAFGREDNPEVMVVEVNLNEISHRTKWIFDAAPECSISQLKVNFEHIEDICEELGINEIGLWDNEGEDRDTLPEIRSHLRQKGVRLIRKDQPLEASKPDYRRDSILMIPEMIEKKKWSFHLFDETNNRAVLTGGPGLLTGSLLKKPSYYIFKMLNDMRGMMLSKGSGYIVTRPPRSRGGRDAVHILLFNSGGQKNGNDKESLTLDEAVYASGKFRDRKEILVKVSGISGEFQMRRYKLNSENNLMHLFARHNFPEELGKWDKQLYQWASVPKVEVSSLSAVDGFSVQSNFIGYGAEFISISRI